MRAVPYVIFAAIFLAVGYIVCPARPGKDVDAARLVQLMRNNCTPVIEGEDTVAGRDAWALRFDPGQKQFPWTQLWIDKRTHEVLASREWFARDRFKTWIKTARSVR